MLYIKFTITDAQKFKDFIKVYEHMVMVRQPNFEFETEEMPEFDWDNLTEEETNVALTQIDEFFDSDAEDRRYDALFPEYAKAFLNAYTTYDAKIAGAFGFDIKGIFNYLEYSFEVNMDNLKILNEAFGVVEFSTGNYPFGGLERFIMVIKAFGLIPVECFDGFSVFEFNWTSKFTYEGIKMEELTKTYLDEKRKVRGHNRIIRNIDLWKDYHKDLDLDYLNKSKRNYCKFWVRPFSDISVYGSEIPSPKGKIRVKIIESFIEIYESWDLKLKTLNTPYYLVLWLYENNLERSQVVCALDDWVNYYKRIFFRPEQQPKIPLKNFGKTADSLSEFNWIYAHEEGWFTKSEMDEEKEFVKQGAASVDLKWFKRKLKSTYRTDKDINGELTYFQKLGSIWIGTKN